MGSHHRPSDIGTILDTIDFLDKSQNLLKAARMAAQGASGLDSEERAALACIRDAAEDALNNDEARLEKVKDLPTRDKQA